MITSFARKTAQRLSLGLGAAAIVMTGALLPAPARANTEDLARLLFGAAVVAIIVRGFDNADRVRVDPHRPRNVLPHECLGTVRIRGRDTDVYDHRCLQRAEVRRLPEYCEVTVRTGDRNRRVHLARCLYDEGFRAERPAPVAQRPRLPQACETTYRVRGGRTLDGYSAHCLRNEGLRNLPQSCEVRTRDDRRLFDAQCLVDAGYRRGR
jgi:hypothetical protein